MADFNRSKSYSYSYSSDRMQIETYRGPDAARSYSSAYPNDFRSYSVSYSTSYDAPPLPELPPPPGPPQPVKDWKLKKGKSTNGSTSTAWSFNDPEFQRKRRVASYKVYSVEGKVKGSFRRSFRWLKNKYTQVVYGWW
ncbi:OLC1v1029279C1 [Oldenlandia corymbosa var. corymbosa]|uniref:OLC1v1029279C1 n=1 Tax=Oldenlandia corymbosa var. corymbosa TaxID=529605 RepID=A0AAV1CE66_OLDCO|nr:OLC1v1029279C1 [Oldenlandia corymbosa var. corymbosa]